MTLNTTSHPVGQIAVCCLWEGDLPIEIQQDAIQAECDKRGWTPEWYKQGRAKRSSEYIQGSDLEKRLYDPNVVALIAYDLVSLSRIKQPIYSIGQMLQTANVTLILCSPKRRVDTSDSYGQIFFQFAAMVDQLYAEDITARLSK